ncbi:daunorubicin C-13 ketoreductase [Plectosphaerella plurivora]|uniref:Daunorubicin C-13 ketoreductase n=1 Tax=Plectosphaerella plurivora TaxID=936078 RepID=A0A9P8VM42_9PEZI|nr:daunorubicin C-13 ketoreductase [Plectosphaerella plurivora]
MTDFQPLDPKTWDPLSSLPDLTGKIAVVTGSSTGIGLGTVKFLALKGAKVYMAARSASKVQQAITELRNENPGIKADQITWLKLDVADLKSISEAVAQLKTKESKLDILVNNAAFPGTSSNRLSSGWEPHIGTDHAGHFTLTNLLLPLLEAAAREPGADVRVVTVSSNVPMLYIPTSYEPNFTKASVLHEPLPYVAATWLYGWSHLFKVDMFTYAVAKLACSMFAQELQSRFTKRGSPIISIHLNPGGVNTASSDIFRFGLKKLLVGMFMTPDQGAMNNMFAAAAPVVRDHANVFGGKYLEPVGKVTKFHPALQNDRLVQGLWNNTQLSVNQHLGELGLPPLSDW